MDVDSIFLEARELTLSFRSAMRASPQGEIITSAPFVGGRIKKSGQDVFVDAVSAVNFRLEAGDRLGILGHNGAGKTTLLRLLSGIYHATHGDVLYSGVRGNALNISLGFRPEATGRRNIVLKGLIGGIPRRAMDAFVKEIEAFSEIGAFIDAPFRTYSSGMRARLAFGLATAFHPDILLLDEWLGMGDQRMQEKAATRMESFVSKVSVVVLASHNTNLLRSICTKGLVLEHGKQSFFGSIDDAIQFQNELAEKQLICST